MVGRQSREPIGDLAAQTGERRELLDALEVTLEKIWGRHAQALKGTPVHLSAPEIVRQLPARDPVDPSDRRTLAITAKVSSMDERLGERLPDEFNGDLGLQTPPGTVAQELLRIAGVELR